MGEIGVKKIVTKISPYIGGLDILDFGRESNLSSESSFGFFGFYRKAQTSLHEVSEF
jgi:hypothetical protein